MMGGGGSIQGMITALRNNKNLLSKRKSMFDRDSKLRKSTPKNLYVEKLNQFNIKPKEEQLFKIRERILKENKARNFVLISVLLTGFLIIFLFVYQIARSDFENLLTPVELKMESMKTDYIKYIKSGDAWVEYKEWNAAIENYKKAVDLFPKDYDANYRLALAYTYSCVNKSKHCESGLELIENLKSAHGDLNDILYLEGILSSNYN